MIRVRQEGDMVRPGLSFHMADGKWTGVYLQLGRWLLIWRWRRSKMLPPIFKLRRL